jgi:alkaline phosphatase
MRLNSIFMLLAGLTLTLPIMSLPSLAQSDAQDSNVPSAGPSRPKNIIIMIGDGMGPAYTTAYRYFKDNPDTQEIEQTVFDRLLVGMASTYPDKSSGYVTDSAAAATALATGFKSYNGAISVDLNKQPLATLMEKAKALGLATGIAVSSQVNHATPAAFLTHNESRSNYLEIAQSYLDTDTDVILGGGQEYFSEDLLAQFVAKGYEYVADINTLSEVNNPKVIGLFAPVQLPWAVNNKEGRDLSTLTQKALNLLSQHEQGFVLLVEGSLIDWAGHSNDIVSAMGEMQEFAASIEVVEQFARQQRDTLVVITADHNTGGLSIGANGEYAWHPQIIKNVQASPDVIAQKALETEAWLGLFTKLIGFEPVDAEWAELLKAKEKGQEAFTLAISRLIDKRSGTGWTTFGHTALDVPVFATGPGAKVFFGFQDNTEIANKIFSLLPEKVQVAELTSNQESEEPVNNVIKDTSKGISTAPTNVADGGASL